MASCFSDLASVLYFNTKGIVVAFSVQFFNQSQLSIKILSTVSLCVGVAKYILVLFKCMTYSCRELWPLHPRGVCSSSNARFRERSIIYSLYNFWYKLPAAIFFINLFPHVFSVSIKHRCATRTEHSEQGDAPAMPCNDANLTHYF